MRSKSAIKNIFSSFLTQVITLICGFITPVLIIEEYGSNVNGLVSSITRFLAYISLLDAGFGPVLKSVLYKPIAKKNKEEIAGLLKSGEKFFHRIAYIFIVYIILLAIIYPVIVKDFEFIFTFSLIIILAVRTFFEYFFGITYKLFLQANQKSYVASYIQLIFLIINTLVVVLLIKLNFSIHIVKLVSVLIYVLRPIVQTIYVRKKYNLNLKDAKEIKIKQKWDGLVQHIASIIHTNTDIAILTILSNLIEVSVYSVYSMITSGLRLISQCFNEAMESVFGNMLANSEKDNLKQKFGLYEILYFTIIIVLYSCGFILITPFVKVYTLGINDANYSRYLFGYLIILAELCWAIRQPYNNLIKAAGHFKETKKGAFVEAICNITISLILVNKYGIVGVAIGTLISMLIRTVEFIFHINKNILDRKISMNVKKILLSLTELLLIIIISRYLPFLSYNSYLNWIINAFMVFTVACIVTLSFKILFYRKELKQILNLFKKVVKKK